MNQFRDLAMFFFIFVGLSLLLSQPQEWNWITLCGGYVVRTVQWMADLRPWSIMICMALALALFMTRLKY